MPNTNRREFMKTAGTSIVASTATLAAAQQSKTPPSNHIRHAVIGTGGMGKNHVKIFDAFDDCDLVALCDVDPNRLNNARKLLAQPDKATITDDYRTLLEDPSIDTISIATPDHWHTPISLDALVAGKHVYVEKPCCHNIYEGVRLMDTAKKTGKCVQHGTQMRSEAGIQKTIQLLHEGKLGKIRAAKAINHQFRGPIGHASETEPPLGVNYDMWLGPAPKQPFTRNRWHYNWHWLWDFGTGDIGNDGVHQLDVARWGLNVGLPHHITASGGQLLYNDDHETPDTQFVTYEYDDCHLYFEMRLWTNYPLEGHDNGVVFYGDKGTAEISRFGCHITMIGEERQEIHTGLERSSNARNFLDCVKANTPEKLNAPAHEAAPSSILCHLGNIASRIGRRLHFDPATYSFKNDPEANALVTRTYRKGYELPV